MASIPEIDDKLFKLYESIADKIRKGETPELDGRITKLYASVFNEAIQDGYGKSFAKQKPGNTLFSRLASMQADAYYFAACKQQRIIDDLMKIKDLSSEEFELFKQSYFFTQNRTWLEAEKNMMLGNAQMAERWHQMQEITTLPNLRFSTAGDDHVRPAHAALDGINLPMKHPFWLTHYPPLDYGCRCDVQQNDDNTTAQKEYDTQYKEQKPSRAFGFNPGITGQIVGKDHPYFDDVNKNEELFAKVKSHCTDAEELTVFAQKGEFSLKMSVFLEETDKMLENYTMAKFLLSKGNNVTVRAYHEFGQVSVKQPDFILNNKLADAKLPKSKSYVNGIGNAFSEANNQKSQILIIDLREYSEIDNKLVEAKIKGKTNKINKHIEEVWILQPGGKLYKQKRHL